MRPQVSVIMPVFNGEAYLEAALQSVEHQMPMENLQFIIVNDGSTDRTSDILRYREPALYVINQVNQGAPVARNTGLRVATGDFISFIDADDLWTKGRLTRQLHYMAANPEVELLQERIQHIRFNGVEWTDEDAPFHALSLSAALFRRHLFDRLGPMDETMSYCDDVDWFLRAQRAGVKLRRLDDIALLYRRHENNLTNDSRQVKHYTLRALHKHKKAGGKATS